MEGKVEEAVQELLQGAWDSFGPFGGLLSLSIVCIYTAGLKYIPLPEFYLLSAKLPLSPSL